MNELSTRIQTELYNATQEYPAWAAALSGHISVHIAVMAEPYLSYILIGKKTVESRFSIHRIAPYKQIRPGDLVLMKAGAIVGCFTAEWVEFHDLTQEPIENIAATHGDEICGDANFWAQKNSKRYATLIGVKDVRNLPPISVSKNDRRAWLMLPAEAPIRS
jgi:ASC-1-like (ASCH) protein